MELTRRRALMAMGLLAAGGPSAFAKRQDPKVKLAVTRALDYLVRDQKRQGYWEANGGQYRVAMTALSGMALLCEGSTTTRGKYAKTVRTAVDYLVDMSQPNGLIGYEKDYHYTYGHGFSMLFLSQVLGEEEGAERRKNLLRVLKNAVAFSGYAQTSRGGWGYVSAKDGGDFDEGSTCITQVQGLRACRNAGIPVPKEIIDQAKQYIKDCTTDKGGVQYSIRGGGERPPITAAAVAAMYSAGEYEESDHVTKMLEFCKDNIWPSPSGNTNYFGHWHYTHYYYAQVMYRDPDLWTRYFDDISRQILPKQNASGAWKEGHIGDVYTTAINATILQLDNGYVPIYQR
ncbi:prenyltransferase/squalene oxidase repeat-containing protein [Rubinisphaera margarita]|uniref:prenyltransferase/squalene oxidase repeat-containing protein n=1 Tax=Rubinisphaera margarita TaxID=2909586 RepID=UPI001EE7C0ED|nr:prenyltransferase/squalene oxidase repeat-containing protein [Rubinisphaera margarita]MCG6158423.1 terpene cyclase/mutase family protein [Rubinisphaera margarita]